MSFEKFNFNLKIQATLKTLGFVEATPIQAQAIPFVMEGRDLLGLAQTGTGKTAAFVLPILEQISKSKIDGKVDGVRALILAPTRELASQIEEVVATFGKPLGIYSNTVFGGVSVGRQVQELRRGIDVVVGCPGRVLDHIRQGTIRLNKLQTLVLDEADQMFDMGFIPTVRQIIKALPVTRQNLMFSATMPKDIRFLAEDILRNPERIEVSNTQPVATVTHAIYPVSQGHKTGLVLELLKHTDTESVLIFTRTKHKAKRLALKLSEMGHKVTSLQGNLSQNQRTAAMQGFREGKYQIMVATDIAARGIDISTISHVINYDTPDSPETYTHRIGRTGRAARNGDAFTLVSPDELFKLKSIERLMRTNIERRTCATFDYNAPIDKSKSTFDRPERQWNRSRRAESGPEQRRPVGGPQKRNFRDSYGAGQRNNRGRSGRFAVA